MGLFPRGKYPNDALRIAVRDTNRCLKSNVHNVDEYLDIAHLFLSETGEFLSHLTNDYLHITESAYKVWGDALLSSTTFGDANK